VGRPHVWYYAADSKTFVVKIRPLEPFDASLVRYMPDHPSLCKPLEVVAMNASTSAVVLPYIEGQTLDRCMRQAVDATVALSALRDVCSALSVLHAVGLAHLDVTPTNIIVGSPCATLIDVDIPRSVRLARRAPPGGTRPWAAPEQWRDPKVTTASDVWSIGFLIAEVLASAGAEPAPRLQRATLSAASSHPARRSTVEHLRLAIQDHLSRLMDA
jgi:serine/threonine protein kinase